VTNDNPASVPGYLQTVLEASKGLIQSDSVHNALEKTVQLAEKMLAADAFGIWQIDRGEKRVKLLLSTGLSASYLESTEVPIPEDFGDLTEMIVSDVDTEALLDPVRWRYKSEGIRSLLVLPLTIGAEIFGTLTLYYRSPHVFQDEELTLARTLANLAAAAIASGQLLEGQIESKRLIEEALENSKKIEARLEFLNRAGSILTESLDYEVTLRNLTRVVVPEYADWCTVHLVTDGEVKQVALTHNDPARVRWAEELQSRYPSDPNASQGVHNVIRSGKPEMMAEIPRDLIVAAARDKEHLRLIEEAGLKSYICVPLRTRSGVIGALTLVQAESGRFYEHQDMAVVEEVGWRAGLAVEKARLFLESERARAELELSNQAKDEFLSIVSHELRTPITTIFGSARFLKKSASGMDEATRDELITGIEEESAKMARLIESLLMLARLEVGQALQKRPVELRSCLRKCIEPFEEQGRLVRVNLNTARESIEADPTYLEHVLSNLLSNADKYSPLDGVIEIVVDEGDGMVLFRVIDEGPGVEPAELELIFDSFYRSPNTSHLPGKGLGLGICRRLIEAQGGTIRANLPPTGGLEIVFSLPQSVGSSDDALRFSSGRAE